MKQSEDPSGRVTMAYVAPRAEESRGLAECEAVDDFWSYVANTFDVGMLLRRVAIRDENISKPLSGSVLGDPMLRHLNSLPRDPTEDDIDINDLEIDRRGSSEYMEAMNTIGA
jgi:hypothetical protein